MKTRATGLNPHNRFQAIVTDRDKDHENEKARGQNREIKRLTKLLSRARTHPQECVFQRT